MQVDGPVQVKERTSKSTQFPHFVAFTASYVHAQQPDI